MRSSDGRGGGRGHGGVDRTRPGVADDRRHQASDRTELERRHRLGAGHGRRRGIDLEARADRRFVFTGVVLACRVELVLPVARNICAGAQVRAARKKSPNSDGGVDGSSTQRVSATPDPPLSSALTDTPTGSVYQSLFPFGTAGDTMIVVTGAAESGGLSSAEMFRRKTFGMTRIGCENAPTAGRVADIPNATVSPAAPFRSRQRRCRSDRRGPADHRPERRS